MAIRVYKPTSSARRFMSVLTYEEITKKTPEKSKKKGSHDARHRFPFAYQRSFSRASVHSEVLAEPP